MHIRERQIENGKHVKKNTMIKSSITDISTELPQEMNERDGGLAKHAAECQHGIDWENAKIVAKEENWTQRKMLEGIEPGNNSTQPIQSNGAVERGATMAILT